MADPKAIDYRATIAPTPNPDRQRHDIPWSQPLPLYPPTLAEEPLPEPRCSFREWTAADEAIEDNPSDNGTGPRCPHTALWLSCRPHVNSPTCEAHKCRCAKPIAPRDPSVASTANGVRDSKTCKHDFASTNYLLDGKGVGPWFCVDCGAPAPAQSDPPASQPSEEWLATRCSELVRAQAGDEGIWLDGYSAGLERGQKLERSRGDRYLDWYERRTHGFDNACHALEAERTAHAATKAEVSRLDECCRLYAILRRRQPDLRAELAEARARPAPTTSEPGGTVSTDDAPIETVARGVLACANAWEPDARLIGNVRAADVARLAKAALLGVGRPVPTVEPIAQLIVAYMHSPSEEPEDFARRFLALIQQDSGPPDGTDATAATVVSAAHPQPEAVPSGGSGLDERPWNYEAPPDSEIGRMHELVLQETHFVSKDECKEPAQYQGRLEGTPSWGAPNVGWLGQWQMGTGLSVKAWRRADTERP